MQRAVLMTLYGTGMRRMEVSLLKVSDVDSRRMMKPLRKVIDHATFRDRSEMLCIDLDFLHHRRLPRKIASRKNAKPSSENGIPMIAANERMNSGHSRPSSKGNTVPETAPTAARIVVPFAHRFASSRYASSRVTLHLHSAITIIRGRAMPIAAKIM
jgi:hypothetical protein